MSFEKDNEHVSRGLGRRIERWKKDKFGKLLESYLEILQELEDEISRVYYGRFLENAEGAQLDKIGRRVGQGRGSFTDEQYRLWLQIRIKLNRSFGRAWEIIEILKLVTDHEFHLRTPGNGPAQLVITFEDSELISDDFWFKLIQQIAQEAAGAGVEVTIIFPVRTVSPPAVIKPFKLKRAADTGDPTLGLSDSPSRTMSGGVLSHVRSV